LAARTAWLAERALAFELSERIGIVKLDYFPSKLLGVTGADQLQLDLVEKKARKKEKKQTKK
jgi:hypothetical protein